MGKSLPSLSRILQEISRAPSSSSFHNPNNPKRPKPILKQFAPKQTGPKQVERGVELGKSKSKMEEKSPQSRYKLSMVVNDCVKRWFQDTLKEAKGGDCSMQVLVGQMYYSGYGVPRDPQKETIYECISEFIVRDQKKYMPIANVIISEVSLALSSEILAWIGSTLRMIRITFAIGIYISGSCTARPRRTFGTFSVTVLASTFSCCVTPMVKIRRT
ncbi:hypothetical protein GIB67_020269 [Kingdonia uniflora]|uniref:Uncharacterized protein n=1 Tax=Kingdonia uniflora TaxID=39325 RepID=A0A7J7P3Q4_9MAGN|nr:hypothetical protein GIB67_020269 [Kingdonia uniflora]